MRIVLVAAAFLALACKPGASGPESSSQVKDFAAHATAANYAIMFGDVVNGDADSPSSDFLRYANYLASGYLGRFDVTLQNHDTTRAEVLAAFQKVGASIKADGSLFVAYTGKAYGGKLLVKDGSLSLGELIAAMGPAAKGARFFFMNDSLGNERGKFMADGAVTKVFPQIVEFTAFSPAVQGGQKASYVGRLSYEFTGETDKDLTQFKANGKNPTLSAFFGAVSEDTTRNSAEVRAEYVANDPNILAERLFNEASFPKPQAPVVIDRNASFAAAVSPVLDISMTRVDGKQITMPELFGNAAFTFVEISSQWCQPCALAATALAADSDLQKRFEGQKCHTVTLIVNDGDDPNLAGVDCGAAAPKLCAWGGYLGRANAQTAPIAYGHSVLIPFTGKEMNSGYLTQLKPSQLIHRYPYFFVVDRSGQAVAQPTADANGTRTSGEEEAVGFVKANCQ